MPASQSADPTRLSPTSASIQVNRLPLGEQCQQGLEAEIVSEEGERLAGVGEIPLVRSHTRRYRATEMAVSNGV